MVKLVALIVTLSVVASCVHCERATLQKVLDDRIKQVTNTTTESLTANDGSLPVIVSQSTFIIDDQPLAHIETKQDSKATQTVDESEPQACTCATPEPPRAKTPECGAQAGAAQSSANALPPASVSVKPAKQDKTKKYRVITITLPDDTDTSADAANVEAKSAIDETKETKEAKETKQTEVSADTDIENQEAQATGNVEEAAAAKLNLDEELEEEAPRSVKEVKNKKEKKAVKKSKYDNSGDNKRDKRDTKKGGSGKNKRYGEGKSKNGSKNKNNKGKNKK